MPIAKAWRWQKAGNRQERYIEIAGKHQDVRLCKTYNRTDSTCLDTRITIPKTTKHINTYQNSKYDMFRYLPNESKWFVDLIHIRSHKAQGTLESCQNLRSSNRPIGTLAAYFQVFAKHYSIKQLLQGMVSRVLPGCLLAGFCICWLHRAGATSQIKRFGWTKCRRCRYIRDLFAMLISFMPGLERYKSSVSSPTLCFSSAWLVRNSEM